MATTEAAVAAVPIPDQRNTRRPRQRRPQREAEQEGPQREGAQEQPRRRGGGGRGRGARDSLLALRPSSVAPSQPTSSAEPSSANVSAAEQPSQRRQQQSRRGRGAAARENRTVNGRAFGGRLTGQAGSLQADAAVFVPGQPTPEGQSGGRANQRTRQRRASKSTAPDIATRTHEDIDHGHYECPICTSEVLRNSKVWSCKTCWTVFHLACVKKWSTNEGSAAARRQSLQFGDLPPPRQWRCPGCNLPKDTLPTAYTCWCEKELEPKPLAGIPPHSCGNTCGKERVRKCPHPCQLTCHAGPCPPCTHMGPTQSCFCAKHESTRRCVDTTYESGWSCGEVCGELMPCGEHACERPCHEGLCGACEVRVDARCYCGQIEKAILCCDRDEEEVSHTKHIDQSGEEVSEEWTGTFRCANTCNQAFDCGVHHCEQSCHVQNADSERCPRSPDIVTHCPCGKTPLSQVTESPRRTCQDPILNCAKPCMKQLPCGHACELTCHGGDCLPCMKRVQISCRCDRTSSTTICHQGKEEPPQCRRVCRTTLSCGRHACDERCCTGERKAAERLATKRKQRPINAAPRPVEDGFEAEHICTRLCDRPLKCGNHTCQELCHKGPCNSCPEAIFHEITCHCGRTVLQPPLACGTQPPPCRYQCERPKTCGHPQVQHTCHQNNENCPRCPFLVERRCMCGKKLLKNQQCWLQDVRCGEICGQKLKCGSHFCRKQCHRGGECEDAGGYACQQACGKPKTVCGHPDENMCHAPYPCKEDKPCPSKMMITCECQAQRQEMRCNASKSSEGNLSKSLPCNEECARLERNRRLAVALNIDQAAHVDGGDHVPYSAETLSLFQQNGVKWSQNQEREFRVFATSDDEKRLRFKPMPAQQRAFIHALAEDFGFDSESLDPEPHRHVALFKSPRFVAPPNKTVAECVRIRIAQQGPAKSDSEAQKKATSSSSPFNAYVLSNPRFGLTIEEVKAELASVLPSSSPMQFEVEFLPSEEVILKALSRTLTDSDLEQSLTDMKVPLSATISGKALGHLQLCHTDSSLNIHRRESDPSATDGWSRVAAKGAAPRRLNQQSGLGGNNSFSALSGNKMTFSKKEKKKALLPVVPVVDDWEAAELEEEEREKGAVNSGVDEEIVAQESVAPLVKSDGGNPTTRVIDQEPISLPDVQNEGTPMEHANEQEPVVITEAHGDTSVAEEKPEQENCAAVVADQGLTFDGEQSKIETEATLNKGLPRTVKIARMANIPRQTDGSG